MEARVALLEQLHLKVEVEEVEEEEVVFPEH
jgi:hypothetical protein